MKKFLALILALCMCFSLVACAGDSPADDTSTPDTTITDITDPSEDESVVDVVFSPVTLVSNDRVIFKVTSEPYRDDFWDAYTIDVYVENPTDKTIYVAMVETSVNDCMIDPYFTIEIAEGKKANETFSFMKEDLDRNHITESIDKIAFKLAIYDADWSELYRTDELSITFE
jgi:hypothetical protein